jgi:hypothetical protein
MPLRRSLFATLAGVALTVGLLLGAVRGDPPVPDGTHEATHEEHGSFGPPPVSCLAQPSNTPAQIGYYVGGGCPCCRHGDPHHVLEGTWGWDWTGFCFHRKVDLLWWHGRYQGGTGAYKTDGPQILHHLHEKADH